MYDHAPASGPLVLIIHPSGNATAERLPANPLACATAIHDAIGGHYEAIGGGPGGWVAYVAEDERQFPEGLRTNYQADALARALGWHWKPGDYAKGVAVFIGRAGVEEADVPDAVLNLAHAAGLI
jgi:hypothetical protein